MQPTATALLSAPLPASMRRATSGRAPRYDTRGLEIRSQRDAVIASLLRCPGRAERTEDARAAWGS